MILDNEKLEKCQKGEEPKTAKILCRCEVCGLEFCRRFYRITVKNPGKYCKHCATVIRIREYNKSQTGKTWEELHGKEAAEKMKVNASKRLSKRRKSGDLQNVTWSVINKSNKGKTFEEIYGKEKAAELKEKLSERFSGENNPMFGKPSPKGSGNGWSGWYKNFYFRSLLELSFLIREQRELKSAESIKIPYIDFDGTARTYHPDFICENTLIEIKPKKLLGTATNKLKFEAGKKFCENNDFQFKILTEDDIEKLSDEEIQQLYDSHLIKFIEIEPENCHIFSVANEWL